MEVCLWSMFFLSVSVLNMGTFLRGCFASPVPPFHCFISVMGDCFSHSPEGLKQRLPGFASIGSVLHPHVHVGAGWQ